MSKMRIFKFWNEAGDEKEKESMSLKKAIKGEEKWEKYYHMNFLLKNL